MAGDMALVNLMIGCTSILAGITSELLGVRPAIIIFAVAAAIASIIYLALTASLRQRLHTKTQQQ